MELVVKNGKYTTKTLSKPSNTGLWESARHLYLKDIIEDELVASGDKYGWSPAWTQKEHRKHSQDYWIKEIFSEKQANQILMNANKFADQQLNLTIKNIVANRSLATKEEARNLAESLEWFDNKNSIVENSGNDKIDMLTNLFENSNPETINIDSLKTEFPELSDSTYTDSIDTTLSMLGDDTLGVVTDTVKTIHQGTDLKYMNQIKTIDNTLDGIQDSLIQPISKTKAFESLDTLTSKEMKSLAFKLGIDTTYLETVTNGFENYNKLKTDIYYNILYPTSIANMPAENRKQWELYSVKSDEEKTKDLFKYEKDNYIKGVNLLNIANRDYLSIPNSFESEYNMWKETIALETSNLKISNTDGQVSQALKGLFSNIDSLKNLDFKDLGTSKYVSGQFIGHMLSKYGKNIIVARESHPTEVSKGLEKYENILTLITNEFPINEERDTEAIAEFLGIDEKSWKLLSRGFLNGLPGGFEKSVLNLYESQVEESSLFHMGDDNYKKQEELLRQFMAMILVEKNQAY
tara:strand:- start:9124 stop:10686 length:1563 start_codon:yes stop_codon:yes gene_type:complete